MGVNIHFTNAQPGELEMLSQAGFRWVRMDFSWSQTERTAGVYDFSAYERLLDQLDQFHIRAMLILDYTNPLYDANKPSHTDQVGPPSRVGPSPLFSISKTGAFYGKSGMNRTAPGSGSRRPMPVITPGLPSP